MNLLPEAPPVSQEMMHLYSMILNADEGAVRKWPR